MDYQKKILSDYEALYRQTYKYLKQARVLGQGRLLRHKTDKYPCGHDPCCKACYFGSKTQRDFEELAVGIIGSLEVSIGSLISTLEATSLYDDVRIRVNHLGASPKYQLVFLACSMEEVGDSAMVKVSWKDAMQSCLKYLEMKKVFDQAQMLKNNREGVRNKFRSMGGRGHNGVSPCDKTCYDFKFCLSVDDDTISRKSVYDSGEMLAHTTGRPPSSASTISLDRQQGFSRPRPQTPVVESAPRFQGGYAPVSTAPLRVHNRESRAEAPIIRPRSRVAFAPEPFDPNTGIQHGPNGHSQQYRDLLDTINSDLDGGGNRPNSARGVRTYSRASSANTSFYNGPPPAPPSFMLR